MSDTLFDQASEQVLLTNTRELNQERRLRHCINISVCSGFPTDTRMKPFSSFLL
jgi:hypothetical protein